MKRKITQVLPLAGTGLNSDDSLELMAPGDSPTTYANPGRQNVIVPPDNFGKLEDAWGTTLVAATDRGLGTKYMGHAIDTDREWCYYFLTGYGASLDSHSIMGVRIKDGYTVRVVMENEPELELDADIVFKKAAYIDGWLYWASGQYGPKKLHITRAMNFTTYKDSAWDVNETYQDNARVLYTDGGVYEIINGVGLIAGGVNPPADIAAGNGNWGLVAYAYPNTAISGSASLLDGAFDLVEMPPITQVTGAYSDDTSRLYNNLRGKMFQFTYRWKYRNGGYSNTAPFSDLFLTPDVESYNGEILNSFATNNVLTLYFNSGRTTEVEFTELFVRTGPELSWQYVDKIDSGTNTYLFYNDYVMEVVSDDMVGKLDNYIPRETRALELLSENVLVLGGNKYGFNNVTPAAKLTVGWENVAINAAGSTRYTAAIGVDFIDYFEGAPPPGDVANYNQITLNNAISAGGVTATDILVINLNYASFSVTLNYIVTAADISGGITALRDSIITLINNEGANVTADYGSPPSGMTLASGDFYLHTQGGGETINETTSSLVFYAASGVDTAVNKWSQFTTGARHVFGITYFDRAMRPFAIASNGTTEVYVKTVADEKGASETYDWRNYINWEIWHEAPAEAKYWQWFYAGNQNIENFWFYVVASVAAGTTTSLQIDITPLQTVQATYPLSQVGPYVWQKGDRVRAVTRAAATSAYGVLIPSVDLEILSIDADTNKITVSTTGSGTYNIGTDSLIEIYRPKTTFSEDLDRFFSFGKIYETYVLSANVYHMGDTANQTGEAETYGAKGVFNEGDSYLITRAFNVAVDSAVAGTLFLVESPSYSDFYDSDWYTQGKLNIRSNIGEVELNNLAISNKLIQDTGINGLCTFEYNDIVSLPDKNGKINALRQLGSVLRVIQQRKRTSFYVGMTEFYNQDGTSNLVASSGVLGNARELDGDWGTEHPETVVQVDDMLFFFDIHNRAFVQDSENGAYPISDNKMRQFFLELGDDLMVADYLGAYYLVGCDYEPTTKCLYFLYYYQQGQWGTVLYHLPSKRWVSYLLDDVNSAVYLGGYIRAENRFYYVYNGDLHELSSDAERRMFTGSTTRSAAAVIVAGNAEPLLPKVIDTVGVISNQHTGWTVVSIFIPADATTKVDQLSWVIDEDWFTREGITRAPVKRNTYSSGVYDYNDLWEGDKMRGRVSRVAFTLPVQTSGKVEITAFEIGMTTS